MNIKKPLTDKDIRLMASFLADRDETAAQMVRAQLKAAIKKHPEFRPVLNEVKDAKVAKAVQDFLRETHCEDLREIFDALGRKGENLDLEEGAAYLASFAYPSLTRADIAGPLDELASEADRLIDSADGDPEEELTVLRRYLFKVKGFQGNVRRFNDPENSYLNRVLERRYGIPITLSCVYLLVAWRLDLAAHGIGLPGHFIVGHELPSSVVLLDPFHEGRILTIRDCETLVRQHGLSFREEYLAKTSNKQILIRMIVNLINIYTDQKEAEKVGWLTTYLDVLQGRPARD